MNAGTTTSDEATDGVVLIEDALRPITARGWRRGLAPLLRKELGQWWGTRQWIVQALAWLVLVNGVVALVMMLDSTEDATAIFLSLGMGASAIGVIVTLQGAIVGERQRGTAAWVLSKPVSRSAFLLAKLIAYVIGFVGLALLVPLALFLVETRLIAGETPTLRPLLGAVGVWAVHLLFFLTLALALGSFFSRRGPVAAIGVGVVLTGVFFGNMIPLSIVSRTPWVLPDLAGAIAHGDSLPVSIATPIVANLALASIFVAAALWRLRRQEW